MPDPQSHRPRRLARIPTAIWAATAAFAGLAALWSVVAPLGEAPDETAHLALVWHLADGGAYPDFDEFQGQVGSFRLCSTYASSTRACPRRGEEVTATSTRRHPVDDAPDRGTRPAWDDADGARPVGPLNQMTQHPPLYYRAMAAVLQVERAVLGAPMSADRELALLRLANVAIVAPLPALAWWGARRFGHRGTVAVAAALVMLCIPMLTHISSTLNNDNLLTLCGAVVGALVAGVLRGDRSRRTAVLLGIATGVAMLTKGFAVVFPPAIVVAYVIGARVGEPAPWARRLRAIAPSVALVGAITVASAGWWYLRVWRRTGQFAPSLEAQRLTTALRPDGFSPDVASFLGEFLTLLGGRFWGSFGWYSVRFPGWLVAICTVAAVSAVVSAFVPRRDAVGASRWQRAGLLATFAGLFVFVLARTWDLYVTTGGLRFIQGRYLFAGLVGVAVLVAAGSARPFGPRLPPVVLVAAGLLQAEALRRALQGWWGDVGLGPRGQVRAMVAWSGWPGEVVAAIVVAAVLASVWLVWEVARMVPVGSSDP